MIFILAQCSSCRILGDPGVKTHESVGAATKTECQWVFLTLKVVQLNSLKLTFYYYKYIAVASSVPKTVGLSCDYSFHLSQISRWQCVLWA